MDLGKSIRLAVDSGKVVLGLDKARKLGVNGEAKLIVFSKNCPGVQDLKHFCDLSSVSCIEFDGTSIELGAVCGKPFSVSALSILDAGDSDVLSAVKS